MSGRPETREADSIDLELHYFDESSATLSAATPTWRSWREAFRVVIYPPHLRKTILIALAVGTILFAINQLDVVLRGDATTGVWIKSAVTYLVPFCVSNAGVLVASRRVS